VSAETRRRIDDGVRRAAYRIIEGKGATYYGIGAGLARIVRAVRNDERVLLTVSSRAVGIADFPEVSFSLPRIIGSAGILATLLPALSEEDHRALMDSVEVIRSAAGEVGF
jgi:L-lactate dehydrogenase